MGHSQSKPGQKYSEPWETSSFATYLSTWADNYENCSFVKHPRGPLSPKRQPNGLILMTYYNTAPLGAFASHMKVNDRNNMWLTVGHEITLKNGDKTVQWTQPELALYERDHTRGHGYPDVITDLDGQVYITETYKSKPMSEAKTHTVDMHMLNLLYTQTTINATVETNINQNLTAKTSRLTQALPNFNTYNTVQYGMSLDLWLATPVSLGVPSSSSSSSSAAVLPTVLVDATTLLNDTVTVGLLVHSFSTNGTVMLTMQDDTGGVVQFQTDPVCSRRLLDAKSSPHHVGILVDGGPKMVSFVVDGKLCDGGTDLVHWPNGHYLMDSSFGSIGSGVVTVKVNTEVVKGGHLYDRTLYVTEMIGNWRARRFHV